MPALFDLVRQVLVSFWVVVGLTLASGLAVASARLHAQSQAPVRLPIGVPGQMGFADAEGRLVIPVKYRAVRAFSERLAAVQSNESGRWGYIDAEGKEAIKFDFVAALDFHEGLAPVRRDLGEDWEYIDLEGKAELTGPFGTAGMFLAGFALVTDSTFGRRFYIDRSGRWRFPADAGLSSPMAAPGGSTSTVGAPGAAAPAGGGGGGRGGGRGGGQGSIAGPFIRIAIESQPIGANVYLIPRRYLDRDKTLADDPDRLSVYRLPEGRTNQSDVPVMERVYWVLFEFAGQQRRVLFDVTPTGSHTVRADFGK